MKSVMTFFRKTCLLLTALLCGAVLLPAGVMASEQDDAEASMDISVTASPYGDYKVGDMITWTVEVFNTGNVEISNITIETEPSFDQYTVSKLQINDKYSVDCSYMVTQADFDAGKVIVSVDAVGFDPNGNEVSCHKDSENTTAEQKKSISRSVTVLSELSLGRAFCVGETLSYEIVVINDGNVTIPGVTVDDPLKKGKSYYAGNLAPGVRWSEKQTYTVTEEDGRKGTVLGYNVARSIKNEDDLFEFAADVNRGDTSLCAVLMNDITVSEGRQWLPIGFSETTAYEGIFDGKGHVVKGLKYDGGFRRDEAAGMFRYVNDGVDNDGTYTGGIVRNLIVADLHFTECPLAAGIVAYNYGRVENCRNESAISAGETGGGIVAFNEGIISNCCNTGKITGIGHSVSSVCGGIAGDNTNTGKIVYCRNSGAITNDSENSQVPLIYVFLGGLVGFNYGGVSNSYNSGQVTAKSDENCKEANMHVGGLVGSNSARGVAENCYNIGKVCVSITVGRENEYVMLGGLAGVNTGTVKNAYSIGTVSVETESGIIPITKPAGSLIGKNDRDIINCYVNSDICPEISAVGEGSGGVKELTTEQMIGSEAIGRDNMDMPNDAWITKEQSGLTAYYPHLKGFRYDETKADADWPAKAKFDPIPVMLTANSGTFTYDGKPKTVSGFTCDKEGVTFSEKITATAEQTNAGTYQVTFSGVELNVTTDTTGVYLITGIQEGTLKIDKAPAPEIDNGWLPYSRRDLIENGTAQELFIAPGYVPEGYSIVYRFYGMDETWYSEIPKVTKGGYYILEVLFKGDGNHADSEEKCTSGIVRGFYEPVQDCVDWTHGSKGKIVLHIKEPYNEEECFEKFLDIVIDGDKKTRNIDYDTRNGSVYIEIYDHCLNEYGEGEHTIKVLFNDGETAVKLMINERSAVPDPNGSGQSEPAPGTSAGTGEGTPGPVIDASPSTGDSSRLMLWAVLAMLSSAGFGTAVWLKRRNTAV